MTIPDKIYFKIGEVARLTGVKPYVLRYWETEFKAIQPVKSRSRQRLYRKRDVELILKIKELLYQQRFTIEGARKRIRELLGEGELAAVDAAEALPSPDPGTVERARGLARELLALASRPLALLAAALIAAAALAAVPGAGRAEPAMRPAASEEGERAKREATPAPEATPEAPRPGEYSPGGTCTGSSGDHEVRPTAKDIVGPATCRNAVERELRPVVCDRKDKKRVPYEYAYKATVGKGKIYCR